MIKNYLKIALRNIGRCKAFSFINVAGLVIGMVCAIFILLWVLDELGFDRFHKNANELYRVVYEDRSTEQISHNWRTPSPFAPAMKAEFPEFINVARYSMHENTSITYETKSFNETVSFADPSIFDMFTFTFIKGDPKKVFANPNSALITEDMAKKYFGDEDPIDKILKVRNQVNVIITGVIKDMPHNGHIQFDFLIQFETMSQFIGDQHMESWTYLRFQTFVLVGKRTNINDLNQKISGFLEKKSPKLKTKLFLQPLIRIHLYGLEGGGAIIYVYIFSLIACFVLVIACINFMNLSTARSSMRAKEIGLRKVVGANRMQLIKQFLGESFLLTFISYILALILVAFLLPLLNDYTGKHLAIDFSDLKLILGFIAIVLFTGLFAGSYAAFFLSSLQPAKVLKGDIKSGSTLFRKILVVFQFSISIILIICTSVISKQLNYIHNRDLGFDKNNLVCIRMYQELANKYEPLRAELLQHSDIINVTSTSVLVGTGTNLSTSNLNWEGNVKNRQIYMNIVSVEHDFIETFKMEMVLGRGFSRKFSTDSANYIVNQEAVKQMDMESPIGKKMSVFGYEGSILGVVKDFNLNSLHTEIEPMLLLFLENWNSHIVVRINPGNISKTIGTIKETVKKFAPESPFEYRFLDDNLEEQYRIEEKMKELIGYFAFLAIFVSCLGLFGLGSFMVERKIKEIGIRKVLGASVSEIVLLLSKEFSKWVLLANIIAWPVGYYVMNRWLLNFAFRTNIGVGVLIFSAALALLIALLTISYQSVKAALANPVNALKYE